jgi:hypothetical protein
MEIDEFLERVEIGLKKLEFVERWSFTKKNTTLRIRVVLKPKALLNVYYNKVLRIQSFALIISDKRVWGLDKDSRLGWHEHPIENAEIHHSIEPVEINEILIRLQLVWKSMN